MTAVFSARSERTVSVKEFVRSIMLSPGLLILLLLSKQT